MNAPSPSENPFSTRRVRPGAIPYVFLPGHDAETMVARLKLAGWQGQIVGPHGSGKSTLLESLIPAIQHAGRTAVLVTLHDGQRRLPLDLHADSRLRPPMVLIVDGYEQLGRWHRMRLKHFCRRRRLGLLVTSHVSVGLPTLCQTQMSLDVAEHVIEMLLHREAWPWTHDKVSEILTRYRGDLRETLFELYDLYEQRPPASDR
jgi:energy-coupling factor transporter ATP-binding protein EcfA2